MEDIRDFFRETEDAFTIYIVEQKFVVGRGADYFRLFKGKENYIDSDLVVSKRLQAILEHLSGKIPDLAEIILKYVITKSASPLGIIEIVTALYKIFTAQEHQAAGPDVIDPIIIQEGNIASRYLNQLISLHKYSILRPIIIILLKDNNFDRAKDILSGCPHNTNVKMIRNSGKTELFKVINCGADTPDTFLDAFSTQCFSTCSHTKRDVLYNKEWAENSFVKLYSPSIMQIRTNFLYHDKTLTHSDLNRLINEIDIESSNNRLDNQLLQTFRCILRLYRVFCNDGGSQDIMEAYDIAKSFDNELVMAHVYRYAYFLDGFSFNEKLELLDQAYNIFKKNGMEDNAVYCKNNRLMRGFDTDFVNLSEFLDLQQEAIYNVPGLVGMSHILNNVGVAHLMNGYMDDSITYFAKGLDYAFRPERCIQKIALMCNREMAISYCSNQMNEHELTKIMNIIFDNKELMNIPFISARYALNIIAIALKHKKDFGEMLINKYPVKELIQKAFESNILGAGQLLLQLNILEQKFDCIQPLNSGVKPKHYINTTGIRKEFLIKTGYNPFVFSTWF